VVNFRTLEIRNTLPLSPCAFATEFCNNAVVFKDVHDCSHLVEEYFVQTLLTDGNVYGLMYISWYSSNK
jgi:hypothetical protein